MTLPANLYAYTDSLASPETVYTDNTTLSIGQTLYDNTGIDSGLRIGIINQDGTFELDRMFYGFYTSALGINSHYLFSDSVTPTNGSLVYEIDLTSGATYAKPGAYFIDGTHVYYDTNNTNVTVVNCSDSLYYQNVDDNWDLVTAVNIGSYCLYTSGSTSYPLYINGVGSDESNLVVATDIDEYRIHKSVKSLKFNLTDYDSSFVVSSTSNCTLSGTNNRTLTPTDYSQQVSISGTVSA